MAFPTTYLAIYCDNEMLTYTGANSEFVKIGCAPDQGWNHYSNRTRLDWLSFPTAPSSQFQIFFYGTASLSLRTFLWAILISPGSQGPRSLPLVAVQAYLTGVSMMVKPPKHRRSPHMARSTIRRNILHLCYSTLPCSMMGRILLSSRICPVT